MGAIPMRLIRLAILAWTSLILLAGCGGGADNTLDLAGDNVSVSGASTDVLMYRKLATVTLTGQNLDRGITPHDRGITLQSSGCGNIKELAGGTSTTRRFTCTPVTVGELNFVATRVADGAALLVVNGAVPMPQVALRTTIHSASGPTSGDIVVELDPVRAPVSVDNFLQYVNDGAYNNTIFHRVIENFVIQGGGFTPELTAIATRAPITLEAPNGLSNTVGTIAMARSTERDSATSQFFINVADNAWQIDAATGRDGYAVFGKVVAGMALVNQIQAVQTLASYQNFTDIPYYFVVVNSATQTK
jgi:cyclophilin family peptidyl-prolyl cis-trans isomerase